MGRQIGASKRMGDCVSVWNRIPRSALAAFGLAVGTAAVVGGMAIAGADPASEPVTVMHVDSASTVPSTSSVVASTTELVPVTVPATSSVEPAPAIASQPAAEPAPVATVEQPAPVVEPEPAPVVEPAPVATVEPERPPTMDYSPPPFTPHCLGERDLTPGCIR